MHSSISLFYFIFSILSSTHCVTSSSSTLTHTVHKFIQTDMRHHLPQSAVILSLINVSICLSTICRNVLELLDKKNPLLNLAKHLEGYIQLWYHLYKGHISFINLYSYFNIHIHF